MILKKTFKKTLCMVLVFACVLSLGTPLASAADVVPHTSTYINSYCGYIEEKSSGGLNVAFTIEAAKKMSSIGASSISIQKKTGTSTWSTVKQYTSSNYSQLLGSNKYTYSYQVSYSGVTSGSTYRAVVSFYVSTGTDAESRLLTTSSLTIS